MVFFTFVAFVVVVQFRPSGPLVPRSGGTHPRGQALCASTLQTLYESSYIIFKPGNLVVSITIGIFSWAAVGVAYYIVLVGFGAAPRSADGLVAIFIFCISTVIGAVFAMPGGLGGVEGSMVALSMRILGLTSATATAAALLTRFCTLWMGVGIGVVSFLLWPELLAGSEQAVEERAAAKEQAGAAVPSTNSLE